LADPKASWDKPAVTTYLFNNHAVRDERWRYIRYNGGGEELYDHANDPNEWTNLAAKPELAAKKAELAKWLPKENHARIRSVAGAGAEEGEAGGDGQPARGGGRGGGSGRGGQRRGGG
jgi:arylsulfatase A-like enzyme